MTSISVKMNVPFRLSVLPTMPSFESIGRGFLFALKSALWYIVHQSPRNGKLLATWTTLERCKRCSHRSDEKVARAAVSCVGRRRLQGRDVADMPRRFSGTGLLPSDRQRFTNAYALQRTNKNRATPTCDPVGYTPQGAVRSIERTTQTKELRLGLLGRAARCFVLVAIYLDQSVASTEEADRGLAGCNSPTWWWCAVLSMRSLLSAEFNSHFIGCVRSWRESLTRTAHQFSEALRRAEEFGR